MPSRQSTHLTCNKKKVMEMQADLNQLQPTTATAAEIMHRQHHRHQTHMVAAACRSIKRNTRLFQLQSCSSDAAIGDWIEGQLLLHPLRLRMISTQPKILTSSERLSFKLQSKECALIQISAKGSLYQILWMHLVFLHLSEKKSRQTQLQVVLQRPFLRPERNSNLAFRAKKN